MVEKVVGMSTIVWQPAKTVGNYAGFVGRLKSFAIGEVYSIQSDKHVYFVVSERFDIRFTKVDTLDQAKAIAEQRLAEFLSEANLMFVEPKPRKLVVDKEVTSA